MSKPDPSSGNERRRRLRNRNLALLVVLFGLIVLFYLMTIVQFGKPGMSG